MWVARSIQIIEFLPWAIDVYICKPNIRTPRFGCGVFDKLLFLGCSVAWFPDLLWHCFFFHWLALFYISVGKKKACLFPFLSHHFPSIPSVRQNFQVLFYFRPQHTETIILLWWCHPAKYFSSLLLLEKNEWRLTHLHRWWVRYTPEQSDKKIHIGKFSSFRILEKKKWNVFCKSIFVSKAWF